MMRTITYLILLCCYLPINAQIGIGTTTPAASSILEIQSTNKGVLLPRLTSTERDNIVSPAKSLTIYNTDTDKFEYNSGTAGSPIWSTLVSNKIVSADSNNIINTGSDGGAYLSSTSYSGKFIISGTGNITITGIPFQPSRITFVGHANVESYNLNDDNEMNQNNHAGISNSFGSMNGYATNYSGTIEEQVIAVGGHGNSINDISRYASNTHAIGIRYGNQNGDSLGITSASIASFNLDGFTVNVDQHADDLVIIFEAFK